MHTVQNQIGLLRCFIPPFHLVIGVVAIAEHKDLPFRAPDPSKILKVHFL